LSKHLYSTGKHKALRLQVVFDLNLGKFLFAPLAPLALKKRNLSQKGAELNTNRIAF
jgi:hypothetical protein